MDKDNPQDNRHYAGIPHKAHLAYILLIGLVFLAFTIVFLAFPRTTFSQTENRKLDSFPLLSEHEGTAAEYTAKISQWFSDSEPFRDHFMTLSLNIRDALRFRARAGEEAVSFRPSEGFDDGANFDLPDEELKAQGNPLANENAKKAAAGILIVGKGPNVRALMAFGAKPEYSKPYVDLCNHFAETFPDIRIYGLVSPNATEFYLPDKAKDASKPQKPSFDYIRTHLNPKVKFVPEVYDQLAAHTNEDIFLRTDHHWSPLGGYYAAKAFAKAAGVPFPDLSTYKKRVVKGYVGSMYGYSKDIAVKNAPEDFVYYMPDTTKMKYTTTYITYNMDENNRPVSESKPYRSPYFHHFKDGSGAAYTTFMRGDNHIVQVRTNNNSNRKLLIIKDSYGNTIPGYLFHSFKEIHVLDFRYFARNLRRYVKENGITDIVLAFNIFNTCNGSNMEQVKRWITQPDGTYPTASKADNKKEEKTAKQPSEAEPSTENAEKETKEKAEQPAETAATPQSTEI